MVGPLFMCFWIGPFPRRAVGYLASFWISLALLVLAGPGKRLAITWRWIFCITALLFSLAPVVQSFHFSLERSYYDQKPDILKKLVKPGRIYYSPDLVDQYQYVSGNSVKEVYEKLKAAYVPNWPLAFGSQETCYSNPVFISAFLRWNDVTARKSLEARQKFLQYINARYVLETSKTEQEKNKIDDLSLPVYENQNILPKWFSVVKAIPEGDWTADMERCGKPDFSFSENCFIADSKEDGKYLPRTVLEVERTPNWIRLSASGTGKSLIVSSELAFPGWVEKTGSTFTPLQIVNHDFRGILLQPDEKSVEVVYRPTSFRLGFFLSLLAVAIWTGIATLVLTRIMRGNNFARISNR